MPAAMLAEWMAYDTLDPISLGFRGDVQAGMVASTVANAVVRPKGNPFEMKDFMPKFEDVKPKDAKLLYKEIRTWAMLAGASPPSPTVPLSKNGKRGEVSNA